MDPKLFMHQLSSAKTYQMYAREFLMLAENVLFIGNLSKYVDVADMNKTLVRDGSIAFFYDDILEAVICAPYTSNLSNKKRTGKPKSITVTLSNGYNRTLIDGKKGDEFVIMYDNNGKYPIYLDVMQYAERYALIQRSIDVNIYQQRTPRVWEVPQEQVKTFKDMMNLYDAFEESIIKIKDNSNPLEKLNCIFEPAPYVADKLEQSKEKLWSEFLRFIGVASLTVQKKERNIRDEIGASLGGTIAYRFSRYEPRKRAVDEINEIFKDTKNFIPLNVRYYDGMPSDNPDDNQTDNNVSEVIYDD